MKTALVLALIVAATIGAALAARYEGDGAPQGRASQVRAIAYWLFTIMVTFEMGAGALWDLLRIEYVRVILTHLGYPLYLLAILGAWKILCALALVAPRFPRLKEWAYAGAVFNYTGAAASHLFRGDRTAWVGPLFLTAFALVSWALRPAGRRLPVAATTTKMRAVTWYVPFLIVAAMLVVAAVTLPQGAPPLQ